MYSLQAGAGCQAPPTDFFTYLKDSMEIDSGHGLKWFPDRKTKAILQLLECKI
jgi:hypothetical protein